ncbi:hypothetical protein ACFO9Q_08165 [Paenibacillus sp. GCM10023252]|uniref:hypothetical protein n=1 Tax=Paenibacillus sp. GCM10023252 TaxID=3252649 RepID=UPI00361DA8EB
MNSAMSNEQARAALEKLAEAAGYPIPELMTYMDELVKENERLRHRLRTASARGTAANMNSRLMDALRE